MRNIDNTYNPETIIEDIYITVRGKWRTIENISWNRTDVLLYFPQFKQTIVIGY